MKREDTYIIYRSEARGEAARDARNTSEGKKSFIRMKQKFLPKETAVPSEGNFAHSVRPYSVDCKLLTFVFALLFIGANWNEAWGQTTILAAGNRDTVHTRTEIIYVEENAFSIIILILYLYFMILEVSTIFVNYCYWVAYTIYTYHKHFTLIFLGSFN